MRWRRKKSLSDLTDQELLDLAHKQGVPLNRLFSQSGIVNRAELIKRMREEESDRREPFQRWMGYLLAAVGIGGFVLAWITLCRGS